MRMNERALQMTVYSSSTMNSSSVVVLANLIRKRIMLCASLGIDKL
jgi:hypothetical protein